MKLYSRKRRWALPVDQVRKAEIEDAHRAMSVRLETEVIAELTTLAEMDFSDEDVVAVLRVPQGEVELYARPVGPRTSHRALVSVDRRPGGADRAVYHGTPRAAAARAEAERVVASDLGLVAPAWDHAGEWRIAP